MNVKRIVTVIVMVAVALGFSSVPVNASGISVNYRYTTYDNGMKGLWAVDHFVSQVTIESLGGEIYRVAVPASAGSYFETLAAKSPGGDGSTKVAAGVRGSITGGMVLLVRGVIKNPLPKSVTIDFRGVTKPNYLSPFFDSIASKTYLSWGWTFASCGNGTWVDTPETERAYSSSGPNALMGDVKGEIADCQKQQKDEPKWFDPGDDRVEGKAGDRLVVWINPEPVKGDFQFVVYGVNPEGFGFLLTTFSGKEIRNAGEAGVYHNLGNLGVVSISESSPEYFWLAWSGGPYNANGQGLWAKGFHYVFPKLP